MILENPQWKNKLNQEIELKYGNFKLDQSGFNIECTLKSDNKDYEDLVKSWSNNINSTILVFVNEFTYESLSILDYDLKSLLDGINELNKQNNSYVQVKLAENENKLHFVVEKNNLEGFKKILKTLLIQMKKTTEFHVPLLAYPDFYEIINPLLNNLKPKFPDIHHIYNTLDKKITLSGPDKRVEEFSKLVLDYFISITCEKLRSINEEALNCQNMINLLEKLADEQHMLCKFMKKHDGFYLIYFQYKKLETFNQLESIIMQNYTSTKIDFLNRTDALNGQKWFLFKKKNLIDKRNIRFNIDKDIIIFGKKEDVFTLESKIQEFLETNKKRDGIKLDFSKNEVVNS